MAKHTKEWNIPSAPGNDDVVIAIDGIQLGRPSHVRACVNALAGLKPSKLPALVEAAEKLCCPSDITASDGRMEFDGRSLGERLEALQTALAEVKA